MTEDNKNPTSEPEAAVPKDADCSANTTVVGGEGESRRWWLKLFLQPLLLICAGAVLIVGLGFAQRLGWTTAGAGGARDQADSSGGDTRTYICPMLCTPPQIGPGRCPVCEMELVPTASDGGPFDSQIVQVDPVARRVANIRTAPVRSVPLVRTIRAVGELHYDEGSLKTISAYVDGRLDCLYADFTGVVVKKGDHLALVYSPRLYSGQVELLLAKKARDAREATSLQRVAQTNRDMYASTKQRLIELGMTREQIEELELAGQPNSRMHLCAPISGTVIKKYATEGQYVKEGEPIYELADLSTVWLMLEVFPEDAASIRYGQKVEAEVQSLPGRKFAGRVAFIDPTVDPTKRTVGVRVVMPNDDGLLRVGDFAKAEIQVPVADGGSQGKVYDPELANKWISPRHPHVVESSPGKCRVCGADLVPASQFGFTSDPDLNDKVLVVPRNAVLMAGDDSVVYVETEPGRFEIRHVAIGSRSGDQVVVLKGLENGEQIAVSGAFLIDSQMQLAGNPSLIDPTKAQATLEIEFDEGDLPPIGTPRMIAQGSDPIPQITPAAPMEYDDEGATTTAGLSAEDQEIVDRQKTCPVSDLPLGTTGPPIKVMVEGRAVFICCERCRATLLAEPEKYLAKLDGEAPR